MSRRLNTTASIMWIDMRSEAGPGGIYADFLHSDLFRKKTIRHCIVVVAVAIADVAQYPLLLLDELGIGQELTRFKWGSKWVTLPPSELVVAA